MADLSRPPCRADSGSGQGSLAAAAGARACAFLARTCRAPLPIYAMRKGETFVSCRAARGGRAFATAPPPPRARWPGRSGSDRSCTRGHLGTAAPAGRPVKFGRHPSPRRRSHIGIGLVCFVPACMASGDDREVENPVCFLCLPARARDREDSMPHGSCVGVCGV